MKIWYSGNKPCGSAIHKSQTHPDSLSSVEAAAAFLKALFSSSRAAAAGVAEAVAPVESDDPVVMVVRLSL